MITLTPYSFKKQFKVLEMGIKSLASDISEVRTQLSGLSVETDSKKSDFFKPGEIQAIDFVPDLNGRIGEFLGRLEARILDRLEARILDRLNTQVLAQVLDRIEERFSGHIDELKTFISKTNESAFQKTEDGLRTVSGGLRSYVDESLAMLPDTGTRQSPDMDTGMKGLAEGVSGLHAELAGLKAELAGLKSGIAALREKEAGVSVETLQGAFDKLNLRLDDIKTFVATNEGSTTVEFDVQLKSLQEGIDKNFDKNFDNVLSRIESVLSERMEISLKSVAEEAASIKDALTGMRDAFPASAGSAPVGGEPVSELPVGESPDELAMSELAMSELRELSAKLEGLQNKFSGLSGDTTLAIKGLGCGLAKVEQATQSIFGRMDEDLKITLMQEIATLKEGIIEIIRFLMATSG